MQCFLKNFLRKILPVEMVVLTLERFGVVSWQTYIISLSFQWPSRVYFLQGLGSFSSKSCRALEWSTLKMSQCFLILAELLETFGSWYIYLTLLDLLFYQKRPSLAWFNSQNIHPPEIYHQGGREGKIWLRPNSDVVRQVI